MPHTDADSTIDVSRGRPARSVHLGLYVAGLALLSFLTTAGGRLGVLAGSFLVIAVAMPTAARLRTDPLDGVGLYAAASAIVFGIASWAWLVEAEIPPPGVGRDDVASALILVSVGLAAFGVSARLLGAARPRDRLRVAVADAPAPGVLIGVFLAGLLGLAVGIALGAVGFESDAGAERGVRPVSQPIYQFAGLGALAVAACALVAFGSRSVQHQRLLAPLLVVQSAAGFVAGYKALSLAPIAFTGMAYLACRHRVPWRHFTLAAVATVVLLIPANIAYRELLRPNPNASGVDERNRITAAFDETWAYVNSRFRLVDQVALINVRTPDVYARAEGKRYELLPALVFVPRVLWPDKPVLDDGLEFSHTYWEIPLNVRTSTPLTQIGDLLRNFGEIGVVGGMALWGLVVAAFTAVCRRWRSPRLEMLYLVSLVVWVVYVESDLPQLITSATRTMVATAFAAWLLLPGQGSRPGYQAVGDALRGARRGYTSRGRARRGPFRRDTFGRAGPR